MRAESTVNFKVNWPAGKHNTLQLGIKSLVKAKALLRIEPEEENVYTLESIMFNYSQ